MVIEHHDLEVKAVIGEHGLEGGTDVSLFVAGGDQNGNARLGGPLISTELKHGGSGRFIPGTA